jgi:hypothetical protein
MEPGEFIRELHRRWQARQSPEDRAKPNHGEIFISYMREDVEYARLLSVRITELGGTVWLDERRLWPGDSWEDEILRAIRRRIRLFVPIISANTERAEEGYVFREWREGAKRSHSIPRRRFIIPVVVDDPPDASASYDVPEEFAKNHFGHAPVGEPDAGLRTVLVEEIRAMRRGDPA